MKKTLRFLMVAVIAISVTFTSCKKADKETDNTSEYSTHSDDQSRFSNEIDATANDENAAIESYTAFTGRPTNVLTPPCDVSFHLDSTATHRRITITYNGQVCLGAHRTRLGQVVLTMPLGQHWRDVGAVLTTNINNLKITRLSDNKSITINGTHIVTNVTGGRLFDLTLPGATPIVHEITSPGMSVTFDNGSQREWKVAKRRTFSGNPNQSLLVISTVGFHTDNGITGISEWGTNRFGNPFVTSITAPMVIRQDCGFRLVSGQVTHQRMVATVVVTFGCDSTGTQITTCPAGPFYFKLVWTGANGIIRTVILPY